MALAGLGMWVAPRAAAGVVLSEIAATSQEQLADEDGDYEDWIELLNLGDKFVDLEGWHLTDDAALLAKWRFPKVILAPGAHLVVFASDKDRREPGAQLHANFKLAAEGEYLALVEPDGRTVASAFTPAYPAQLPGFTWGLPIRSVTSVLLGPEAVGRWRLPGTGDEGPEWRTAEYPDAGWLAVGNGIGFDTEGETVRVPIADSVADWSREGRQGERGWTYGYYDRSADTVPGYGAGDFRPFPRSEAAHGPANYWTGTAYRWPALTVPRDELGQTRMHPNGAASGGEHWVIRRWTSSRAGDLEVQWHLAKAEAGGAGVTGRLFHNGVQKDVVTIAGGETTGVSRTTSVAGVAVGDTVDLAVTPIGIGGTSDDRSDATHATMTILDWGTLGDLVVSDVGGVMKGIAATAQVRFPFVVTNAAGIRGLRLRVRCNDGFVAWLNGREVARVNAGEDDPGVGAVATATRSSAESVQPMEFDLEAYRDFLQPGTNVLALQGLNGAPSDPTFLLMAGLLLEQGIPDRGGNAYFATPSPGAANGAGAAMIGPAIREAVHSPLEPVEGEALRVEAHVLATRRPVGTVELLYRVMFGSEVSVAMRDDGLDPDRVAGDGRYAARIPALARPGQMVRYRVVASDDTGAAMKLPEHADPRNSPQYFGTVVKDPSLGASGLPVLHWFIERPSAADSDTPARSAWHFAGRFHDNTGVTLHGQSTRGFPKKSYDIDFNPGHKFRWSDDAPGVDDLNLLSTWADKTHLRTVLAYETYRDAGVPSHFAFAVRVQCNGDFFSVANLVENGDDNFLERLGYDTEGALYKMYNSAESAAGNEKKTRKFEGTADLQALIQGLGEANSTARQAYLFDHLDVPEVVNFLAARTLTADTDCCHKNYYLYRDTRGTGEWQAMPWDVDLSFGRVWTCGSPCLAYFDETIYTNQSLFIGSGNRVFGPVLSTPATRQMYLRRLRSLMDQLMQPPGTPEGEDRLRIRAGELRDAIAPDAVLDLARWGTWGRRETLDQAVLRIWNEFLPGRREYLFRTMTVARGGEIPASQTADVALRFGGLEYRPASGVPEQEWLTLANDGAQAVDISGWRLDGGIRFTFRAGTVIPSRSQVYVSPDTRAFRSRTVSPKGGERRFVVGPYAGNLSAWGETVRLLDRSGRQVAVHAYAGDPSEAQRGLRITEIMFHPAPDAHGGLDPEDGEYLVFRNIGAQPLDLNGVVLTGGVEFSFGAGSVTNLPPGARVLVVGDLAAFAARHGTNLPVAGEFVGRLNNAGESLRLLDRHGEKILEFTYSRAWAAAADGRGSSLEVVDERAPWGDWGRAGQWRASRPLAFAEVNPPAGMLSISLAGGVRRLRLSGEAGVDWTLQRSTDLATWTTLGVTRIPEGGALEVEVAAEAVRCVFYRAVRVP